MKRSVRNLQETVVPQISNTAAAAGGVPVISSNTTVTNITTATVLGNETAMNSTTSNTTTTNGFVNSTIAGTFIPAGLIPLVNGNVLPPTVNNSGVTNTSTNETIQPSGAT